MITTLTKSPVGEKLTPLERKHQLWIAVEEGKGDIEKIRDLETWCIKMGNQKRSIGEQDDSNIFNEAVKKEMDIRS